MLVVGAFAQTLIGSQSFEGTTGYKLSHTFDDGKEDYFKRDSSFSGMDFKAVGKDGTYYMGMEDTDAESTSPIDGVVRVDFDSMNISGMSNIQVTLAIAANPTAAVSMIT